MFDAIPRGSVQLKNLNLWGQCSMEALIPVQVSDVLGLHTGTLFEPCFIHPMTP